MLSAQITNYFFWLHVRKQPCNSITLYLRYSLQKATAREQEKMVCNVTPLNNIIYIMFMGMSRYEGCHFQTVNCAEVREFGLE